MGSGKQITDDERAKIDILRLSNPEWTQKQIANAIGRSANLVGRYLKDPTNHGKRNRSGRPKVTDAREDRLITKRAKDLKMSTKQIKDDLNLSCSSMTVWRRLNKDPNIKPQGLGNTNPSQS